MSFPASVLSRAAVAALLGFTVAGSLVAQVRQIRSSTTTPSFQLVKSHTARFVVLDTGESTVPLPVTLQLFDERGRQLAIFNGQVRPGFPVRLLLNSSAVLSGRTSSVGIYARATVVRPEGHPRPLTLTLEFLETEPDGSVARSLVAVNCPMSAPENPQTPPGAQPICIPCTELHIVIE